MKQCKEAFSKATSIQFCTVASHSVNSANEKVVEGQPKNEEKFKYASEKLGSASTLELEEELKVHYPDFFPRRLNFLIFFVILYGSC